VQNRIVIPADGGGLSLSSYGSSLSGFQAGSTMTFWTGTSLQANSLSSTSGFTISTYSTLGVLTSAPVHYQAGVMPAVSAPSGTNYIVVKFDATATVTNLSGIGVSFNVSAGSYQTLGTGINLLTSGLPTDQSKLSGFQPGDTLRLSNQQPIIASS